MIINTINTKKQYDIKDVNIVSTSEGLEAIFISNNQEMFGIIKAEYPINFHPSDEFRQEVCNTLKSKYKRYWNTDNVYSLASDLDELISSKNEEGFDYE